MKISVLMPFFNAEEFIKKSIESVLGQTLSDIELICVDDGSTDNSRHIVSELSIKDPRIKVYSQKNSGSGAARNLAISKAEGEFIAFMDSDDWYPDKYVLERLFHAAKNNNVLIAGGSFVRYYNDGRIESDFQGQYKDYKFEKDGLVKFSTYQFDYGYHRFIYSRDLLLKNKIVFPDYRRYQDPVFFVKAMVCAKEFYAIKEQVYAYRKGHQVVEWDKDKILGLICGLSDNVYISRKYKLNKLHKLNFLRLVKDFNQEIRNFSQESIEVKYFLTRLVGNFDDNLLDFREPEWAVHNLNKLKQLILD